MAIRNYVGARYVPKFADPVEWQANTSYEAMVIVTYNNASYTSKAPVPPTVGNPAENSKYWALTGNYNAQIEEYRKATAEAQEHARDGICAVDEGNNTSATKNHEAHEYFWWKGKLYRAKKDINAGSLLSDGGNVEEGNIADGVSANSTDIVTLKGTVFGNSNKINLLNDDVTNHNVRIRSLETKTDTNTNDIGGLKTNYTRVETNLTGHINNKANPHGVTKAQVGLGNVDNVSKANILLSVYPVGSIYRSTASTSPAELFGGTWERIKDRFLLAAGDTYTAGSTGGEAQHTLTVNEIPSHSHAVPSINKWLSPEGGGTDANYSVVSNNNTQASGLTGGGQAHNNLPPYLAVYIWKRVA